MPYRYQDQWHVKMRAYEKYLRTHHRAERTIKSRNLILSSVWRYLGKPENPLKVSLEEYLALETTLVNANLKINTIVNYMTILKLFLKFCKYPKAEEVITKYTSEPKEDRVFLEEDQIAEARQIAHSINTRCELFYSLAVDNSLRRGDIINITLAQARELVETGRTRIIQKGGRKRLLVLHKRTKPLMENYLQERKDALAKKGLIGDPYLFIDFRTGKHLGSQVVYDSILKMSKIHGTYYRPHDLRATYVRRQARAGTKQHVVMMNTGHKSWTVTFGHYYGQDEREMRNAQDNI